MYGSEWMLNRSRQPVVGESNTVSVPPLPCRVPTGTSQSSFFLILATPQEEQKRRKKSQVCAPSMYTSEADARNKKTLVNSLRWCVVEGWAVFDPSGAKFGRRCNPIPFGPLPFPEVSAQSSSKTPVSGRKKSIGRPGPWYQKENAEMGNQESRSAGVCYLTVARVSNPN